MNSSKRLTDRKRAAILNASISLFSELGFDNTSMDNIAQRAEVSKRTVYNHFSSKDRLFEEIVQQLKKDASEAVLLTYSQEASLERQLIGFCRSVIDFHSAAESRALARALVSRFVQNPSLGSEMFGRTKIFEGCLHDWIHAAQKDGRMGPCDIPMASKQLLALLEAFCVWPQLIRNMPSPNKSQRTKIAKSTVRLFLGTYSSNAPADSNAS
ncbi:MAG: TetR/AcrR family transcriptional regulator [Pirellula staleyi]